MSKDFDDPRRDFLVKALSLGLFAGPNLVSLLQPVVVSSSSRRQL
jgi:hypothetical protein